MKKARRLYFRSLGAALVVFSIRAALPAAESDAGWGAVLGFLLTCVGIASVVATWGTAVMIASVHKVTWPLVLSAAIVVAGGVTFFAVLGAQ